MKALKIGFWALLFIGLVSAGVTFATQNNDLMTLSFFNNTTEPWPKWQILLGFFGAGAVLMTVIFIIELIVLESKNIVLRRVNRKLERALQKYTAPELDAKEPTPVYSSTRDLDDSDV